MKHPHSINAFFNSAFQEIDGVGTQNQRAIFPLSNGDQLAIALRYESPTGRHRYADNAFHIQSGNETQISFEEAAELLVNGCFNDISDENKQLFLSRVQASDEYINSTNYSSLPTNFIESEQSLIGGHNMHPSPKVCEPLNQDERATYMPEFKGTFDIEWFAIKKEHFAGDSAIAPVDELLLDLCNAEGIHFSDYESDYVPLPMHPLQAREWRNSEDAQSLSDAVIDLNQRSSGWTATSSTRAIYKPQAKHLIKCSLPVKLTNSIRLLSEKEVKRGVLFSQLLQSGSGQEIQQRLYNTTFIEEPAWAGIKDHNGKTIDLSILCLRDNVFDLAQDTQLLATLNQTSHDGELSVAGHYINAYANHANIDKNTAAKRWFGHFFDAVIKPLCVCRSDYGFVVLAHQQNILVDFENKLPSGMKYKDCQGTGLTSGGLTAFKSVLNGEEPEYYMESPGINPFFAYYLIGNTLMNTVAAIAADSFCTEQELYTICQYKFNALLQSGSPDSSFYEYMLYSKCIHWKSNFNCFLSNTNESTLENPEQLYIEIDNPVCEKEKETPHIYKPVLDGRTLRVSALTEDNKAFTITTTDATTEFEFVLESHGEHDALKSSCNDETLLLSAIEHVFFSLETEHLTLPSGSNVFPGNAITKHDFMQDSRLWTIEHKPHPGGRDTAKTGIEHPVRPEKETGIVFQRYFYALKQTLTLRMLDIDRDISMFHRWHNRKDIAPVWELEGSLEEHHEYLSKMAAGAHQFAVIGEYNGVPFGYIEIYWAPEDRIGPFYEPQDYDQGVHVLVGNPNYQGMAFGYPWGTSMLHYCYLKCAETQRVVGEPKASNERAVSASALVGLIKQYEFDFPHKRAALTKSTREDFFNKYVVK